MPESEGIYLPQIQKGLEVGAWCMMTNPIHMIIRTRGLNQLEDIIRDLKAFTARHITKMIEKSTQESRKNWILEMMKNAGRNKSNNKDFQFWEQHNHPIELSTNKLIDQRLTYIHENR